MESEVSSDENHRSGDGVMNAYASHIDGCDSGYISTVNSVINCSINECDFSKISCVKTESDINKPANAEFAKNN